MSFFKFNIPTFIPKPFRSASRLYLESKAGQDEPNLGDVPDVLSFERIIADKASPVMAVNTSSESQAYFSAIASHPSRILGLSSLRPARSRRPSILFMASGL